MNILIYFIKTILVSGLLFGYYWLFLRNRFFHSFNRYFLLSIPVLSFLLPALHLSLPSFWNHNTSGSPILLLGVGQGSLEEAVTIYADQKSGRGLSLEFLLITLSLLVSLFLLIRFYKSIRFLYRLRKGKPSLTLPEATIYFVSEKGTPFSFFKSIFWGMELELESDAGQQILEHEISHVKNNHSIDILSLEILIATAWFNPFFYLIHQELKAIHEYTADACVTAKTDAFAYASLLLLKVSGPAMPLTHPFFKNQIKRRISMMTKSKKRKAGLLGRFMILPLITILIGIFSFKMHSNLIHSISDKPIRVVIDAGHGGSFTGTQYNGVFEKNINLNIAKKIQSLASQYNVDVIMSRETDITPGGKDLHESLDYIAALPKNKNADLFISIHTNATENGVGGKKQTSRSGFQIYIPRNSSVVYESSLKFGSVMTEVIKSDYTIETELKQTQGNGGNVYILRSATVPALLIECGYMDNPSDLKYLQDEKNQEKIARDILEGIRKYSLETTSYAPPAVIADDSIPASDTLTSFKGLEMKKIASMNVDRNAKLITITTKDGKKLYMIITDEMLRSMDSAKAANSKASDVVNANQVVFTKVDVEAEYPGGQHAWYDYLSKNLKYPDAAVMKEIQGQVMMEFIVKKNGDLTNIRVISGPEELKGSSIDVIKSSGKWIPAKQNGLVVESYKLQPINYKLEKQ
jgi:N-acetylmuramoyl-L-alanine amidase